MKETFSAKKFNGTYKDFVRDYYTYGFKSFDRFVKSRKTVSDFWKILCATLGEFEYVQGENGRSQIVLTTEETGAAGNPLDRLYFRNGIDKNAYFGDILCFLLGLDPETVLRNGFDSLELDRKGLEKLWSSIELLTDNPTKYAAFDTWFAQIASDDPQTGLFDAGEKGLLRVYGNEQLMTLTWNLWDGFDPEKPNTKPLLEDRMKFQEACGVFGNLKYDTDLRDAFLREVWDRCPCLSGEYKRAPQGKGGKFGVDYWYLSGLTMQSLLKAAKDSPVCAGNAAGIDEAELSERLTDLCGFFAQYYPLGELGTLLRRRIRGSALSEEDAYEDAGFFTFRQNYMQKVLYDYNLVDLLIAIEHDGSADGEDPYLCRITSRHGTNKWIEECLVRPLEIRISVKSGREYLMGYDVIEDRIRALRLEFVDEIVVYTSLMQVEVVKYKTVSGKKVKGEHVRYVDLDPAHIRGQAAIAKEMLPYLWGTNDLRDSGECRVDVSWRERLKTYRIRIACGEDERFIAQRLERENRVLPDAEDASDTGWEPEAEEEIEITCFPTNEFRTWLRSYYVRVLGTEQVEDEIFTLRGDVEDMYRVYFAEQILQGSEREPRSERPESGAAQTFCYGYEEVKTRPSGDRQQMSVYEGHNALFNWLFSDYAVALADAVLENSVPDRGEQDFQMDLDVLAEQIIAGYDPGVWGESVDTLIDETVECLQEIVEGAGLMQPDGSKFLTAKRSYLRDLLPLTKLESRWLVTVLRDPLSEIFLPKAAREAMTRFIKQRSPQEIRPFAVDAIHYFDRHNKRTADGDVLSGRECGSFTAAEIDAAQKAYTAMRKQQKLRVKFTAANGETIARTVMPLRIEYSRRDNQLRILHPWERDGAMQVWNINLSAVVSARLTESRFDPGEAEASVQPYQEAQRTCVNVEFYEGDRNLPDRILTEFSSWKKTCVYEQVTGKFVMTLYYSKSEEREILIRLLAYGPFIRVSAGDGESDADHFICSEMKRRIKKQRERLQIMEKTAARAAGLHGIERGQSLP